MSSAKSIRAWQLIETIAVLTQLVSGAGDQLMAVLAPLLTEWTAVHPYFYDQTRFVTVFCSSEDGMFNFPWAVLEKGLCAFSAVFGLRTVAPSPARWRTRLRRPWVRWCGCCRR
ncbi:hypothetical protein DIPPA_13448 [Diplonema papillatum]|nr:hypothetical protein DIPPA_13448 [Diplonema papillatum]